MSGKSGNYRSKNEQRTLFGDSQEQVATSLRQQHHHFLALPNRVPMASDIRPEKYEV